jgi:hypothetical protein
MPSAQIQALASPRSPRGNPSNTYADGNAVGVVPAIWSRGQVYADGIAVNISVGIGIANILWNLICRKYDRKFAD